MTNDVAQRLAELDDASNQRWEHYLQLLPATTDVSLMVLKGHLIIEEMLYNIAEQHCANSSALTKTKLTFAQLLNLVWALTKHPPMEDVVPAINLLNTIRNSLVHSLNPKELESRLHALLKLCESEAPDHDDLAVIAGICISYICGRLSVVEVVTGMVTQNPQLLFSTDLTLQFADGLKNLGQER